MLNSAWLRNQEIFIILKENNILISHFNVNYSLVYLLLCFILQAAIYDTY